MILNLDIFFYENYNNLIMSTYGSIAFVRSAPVSIVPVRSLPDKSTPVSIE